MRIFILNQNELNEEWIEKIAFLKEQWWPYSIDEQIRYIKNLSEYDRHLIAEKNGKTVGYLRLVLRKIRIRETFYDIAGISTVCRDKRLANQSIGKQIILEVNNKIVEGAYYFGLLQCNDEVVDFYLKCGWIKTAAEYYRKRDNSEEIPVFPERNVMMYPALNISQERIEFFGDPF